MLTKTFKKGKKNNNLQCQSLRHHLGSHSTHTKGRQWSGSLPPLSPQQCSYSSLQYRYQPTSFRPTMLDGGRWTAGISNPSHEPGCTTIYKESSESKVMIMNETSADCQVLLEQVSLSVSTTHISASLAPRIFSCPDYFSSGGCKKCGLGMRLP